MKFKDWFDNKLIVGAFPYLNNTFFEPSDYDYVINMSDEYYIEYQMSLISNNIKSFWFPMNECRKDIGLNSIYGAMVILYFAEKTNSRVYLHCHAGVNRSQTIKDCYCFMRTGSHNKTDISHTGYVTKLHANCFRGYLPPLAEIEKFLTELNNSLNDESYQKEKIMGGLLDGIKIETIRNF